MSAIVSKESFVLSVDGRDERSLSASHHPSAYGYLLGSIFV
ncbi:hypothetical protein [Leptolyngbya sp. FACHB-321]|nr:hypothetical protein [Leptolyngbya sp. FACHB-321]